MARLGRTNPIKATIKKPLKQAASTPSVVAVKYMHYQRLKRAR